VAESSKLWNKLAEYANNSIFLCRLHPRPANWLLRRHDIICDESKILNLNGFSDAESAIAAIMSLVENISADRVSGKLSSGEKISSHCKIDEFHEETSPRWYPVIDGSRCVNCQHCLQFCLFGVYESDARGKVQVRNPDLCKTGCPACARICPQSAIMFPLYEKDDAIAGAPQRFVTLDAAARRMFYARTKQPCPMCGRKAERKSSAPTAGENLCPECGRPQPNQKPVKNSVKSADRLPFDDLDKLVDELDQMIQRRSI
jgi:Pyruvate/2-oxoacid:ferredoxin oxidoreductase delta subunit/ribosomal protein S14